MKLLDYLKTNIVYLDGGMGTLLQSKGLLPGEYPERWNISCPDDIISIHKAYLDAGANVVCSNTFGANLLKFDAEELESIICAAMDNARKAIQLSQHCGEKYVALDIGPSGKLLKPYGDMEFEDAVQLFAATVKLGVKYGADLIFIETFSDSLETKAALLAAKENSNLPVFVSNAYGEDGKLMTGASPEVMCAMLEGMGADAVGMNCSLGPDKLFDTALRMLECASVPIILKPNAGLPKSIDGKTVYDVTPQSFADTMKKLVEKGVRVAGGCCGTTPEYISALVSATESVAPKPVTDKNISVVTSYTKTAVFGKQPLLIGERINPTGKKRFKQALVENDISYILHEALAQQEKGVHILDVNVGIPDIDEKAMLESAVKELQAVTDLPLQIDTADPIAMEAALRVYNGKAMINSVNGKEESMEAVFPLVKKYGGVMVALTLDENGIPATVEGRVEIAKKILDRAQSYGISKKDIIFDTLAMTVSADETSPAVTLGALKIIREQLGCNTSLGVSNVSFGLPSRDAVNSTFFALALQNGLSAAIMNPYSDDMLKTYYSFRALSAMDKNCADYIAFASTLPQTAAVTNVQPHNTAQAEQKYGSELIKAIACGMKKDAGVITDELLKTRAPMEIISSEIIPALDLVGTGYEKKTVYLPQLLMSAEAAKSAFERIKVYMLSKGSAEESKKCDFVLATVHGDIHDIGKNIVRLLLENYGFNVHDLGKDVPPQTIVDKVVSIKAPLVGLSALMTTTVPAMEHTITLLRKDAPWCKIVVGGAVLTKEYAHNIGADKYAADAMETVRYAEKIAAE